MSSIETKQPKYPIDFVLTYVDGGDPVWQEKRQKYLNNRVTALTKNYRSWDNLHYWFRCVAKFAPWVHKIYLVTDHQVPSWLNTASDKIVTVNHDDFIPEQYLPVFSANPIELNLHRIKGLSENFVFFNDDTFITGEVGPEYFFQDGLPCDYPVEMPYGANEPTFSHILSNDVALINTKYNRRKVLKEQKDKFYSKAYKQGRRKNLFYSLWKSDRFFGFENLHLPSCMLKSAYEAVWEEFYENLDMTCHKRFRSDYDVNQYIVQYWMYMHGMFHPYNWRSSTRSYQLNDTFSQKNNIFVACAGIRRPTMKLVCVNDAVIEHFETSSVVLNTAFESIVPDKCDFEI